MPPLARPPDPYELPMRAIVTHSNAHRAMRGASVRILGGIALRET